MLLVACAGFCAGDPGLQMAACEPACPTANLRSYNNPHIRRRHHSLANYSNRGCATESDPATFRGLEARLEAAGDAKMIHQASDPPPDGADADP